jgi:CubicO group peptidase (beta-lactamase class C family)
MVFVKKCLVSIGFLLFLSTVSIPQSKSEKIDDLISRFYEYRLFNGSVLVADNEEVIYEKGFGLANMEFDVPNDPDTKFRIGSITKQFTSMLIMQLAEVAKINLEGKLSEYLPYYRKDIGEKVTINQLLNHTSGIPSYTNIPGFMENESRNSYDVEKLIKEFCSNDLEYEPGSQFSYNNSGYFILGAIIEEAMGMSYEDALHKNIFDPIGMNNSGYDSHNTILPNRASGYTKTFQNYENADYVDMSTPYSAGAIYSTVGDLYKWHKALYTDKLLSKKYVDLMFAPVVPAFGGHYANGWVISRISPGETGDSLTLIRHGGDINGFSSLIYRVLENDQVIILLNNFLGFPRTSIANQILNILYDQNYEYPKKSIADYMYDMIEDEGLEETISTYHALKEEEGELFDFGENQLNTLGYILLRSDNIDDAIEIFKLNIEVFPDAFNPYDSMGEAYMEKGEIELAIKYYKKSIEINPGNNNGIEKLKELGVEPEEELKIDEEILIQYIGEYNLFPNFDITIRVDGNSIFAQATGQPEFEIFPISETKFYYKVVNAQIKFHKNDDMHVDHLILFQNNQEMKGTKLN